jgi:hypothetical protein
MTNPSRAPEQTSQVDVSVVIGASVPDAALPYCLSALEPQRARAQVVVATAFTPDPALRQRFPWAEFYERPGALVPELWRDGIERSRGRIVALTIAPMIPASDWVDAIIREHERHDAVGGAIDPGRELRLVDWAEYFCRYARDMSPFEAGVRDDIAGDNASYKRALLVEERAHLDTGFWEPIIHPVLQRRGVGLWHTPAMAMRQGRSHGFRAFARQRTRHGRLYPRQRGGHFTKARHVIGVVASPAVPFLMTMRVLQKVFAKKRHRAHAIASLPIIFALNVVWAAAEARGHLELAAGR